MKTLITTRFPVKNSLLYSRECMIAILLLVLCVIALTSNIAGGLIYATLVVAFVMLSIHFIKVFWNRTAQLQPALSFYRLNATVTHERNATSSYQAKNKIRM